MKVMGGNIFKLRTIFIPINLKIENHWTLCVIYPQQKVFIHFVFLEYRNTKRMVTHYFQTVRYFDSMAGVSGGTHLGVIKMLLKDMVAYTSVGFMFSTIVFTSFFSC